LDFAQHGEPAGRHVQVAAQRLYAPQHRQCRRGVAGRGASEPLGIQVGLGLLPLRVGQHAVIQQDLAEAQAAERTGRAAVARDVDRRGEGRARFDDERKQSVAAGEAAPHAADILPVQIGPALPHV